MPSSVNACVSTTHQERATAASLPKVGTPPSHVLLVLPYGA
ncbi:hypothetical protein ACJJV6_00835 [Arthrobacter nitrophenolicus]